MILLVTFWVAMFLPISVTALESSPLSITTPKTAPDTTFRTLNDTQLKTSSLKGKVVLVNFWATWCAPCLEELPSIQALFEQLQPKGFEVIAINAFESQEIVQDFVVEFAPPLTFTFAVDPSQTIVQPWQVRVLPTSFVLNREGSIVYSAKGPRDFNSPAILEQISELLQ